MVLLARTQDGGQVMITGITSRMLRPQAVAVGVRQHVAVRSDGVMSKHLAKMVTLILCVSLFVVFAFSQLMHWYIVSTVQQLDELQAVRHAYGSDNIALLAARAQLTSKEYVVEQAGKRYRLFVPQKNQIRRL